MDEYTCEICHQKVSGEKGHLYLDFRDNKGIQKTIEICEFCSLYFLEFIGILETSANLFYQSGIRKKMKIIFYE